MEVLREEDGVKAAETWLESRLAKYHATSLFLPAGETPKALYRHWRSARPAYLSALRLQQVDDIANGPGAGLFARFFEEELPGYRVAPPRANIPADLAILGFGTNGHIAFHEPGLPDDFAFGQVALEPETTARLGVPPESRGITYGLGAFLRCRAILLIVKGAGKQAAYEKFMAGDPALPAARLRGHADLAVWKEPRSEGLASVADLDHLSR